MKAVQELRQSRDSDSQRSKEFTQTASENISDTVERGEINQTTGNRNMYMEFIFLTSLHLSGLFTRQFMTQNRFTQRQDSLPRRRSC